MAGLADPGMGDTMSVGRRPLQDRVAVVTGGSRGIGRAIAERLARDGARIVVNYAKHADAAREVTAAIRERGGEALAVTGDVSEPRAVERLFNCALSEFGSLDILINNAGVSVHQTFLDLPEDVYDRVHAVNMKGTFLCSQAAGRVMVERRTKGRIISISSISAIVGGVMQAHYTPTKAGQRSLMRSLATVLGPHGITCNSVLPGTIVTDINAEFFEDPAMVHRYVERIPAGRLGTPDDVAGAVAFLASDEAAYVNGAEILIDGGALVAFP
jgi:L-rhamnose 1-dehydrogenase